MSHLDQLINLTPLLLRLPLELLYLVSDHSNSSADVNALARCNRQLYNLLNSFLYRSNLQRSQGSALMWAAARSRSETARNMFEACWNIEISPDYLREVLVVAMKNCSWGVMKVLIANGTDANTQGGGFGHILQAASWKGDANFVQSLLDAGADVNAQAGHYGNALTAAAWCGHEHVTRLLIDNGAEVNARGGTYGNALQAASSAGHQGVVDQLIHKRAEVNEKGGFYGSALQAACWTGNKQVVKTLLAAGANPGIQSRECERAHILALRRGNISITRLLCISSIRCIIGKKLPMILRGNGSFAFRLTEDLIYTWLGVVENSVRG
jgi:ankyrin repeat protein